MSAKREAGPPEAGVENPIARYGKTKYFTFAIAAAFILFLTGLFVGLTNRGTPFASLPAPPLMTICIGETVKLLDLKGPPTIDVLSSANNHCNQVAFYQGTMNNEAIRKLIYVQQYNANGVLMWMVVIITISGVLLAGIQLAASYQLAAANKASLSDVGELSLKRDQIMLKSSVTGLFILLLSFAFFLVFVLYVYRIENSGHPSAQQQQQQTQAVNMREGTLHEPPAPPAPK
jgi:hypothetical protein